MIYTADQSKKFIDIDVLKTLYSYKHVGSYIV